MGVGHCLGDLKRPQCHVVLWFQEKDPFQDDCVVIDDVLGAMPHARDFRDLPCFGPAPRLTKKVEVKVPTLSQLQKQHLRRTIARAHFGRPVRRRDKPVRAVPPPRLVSPNHAL